VTDEGAAALADLATLTHLTIGYTAVTSEGVSRLQRSLGYRSKNLFAQKATFTSIALFMSLSLTLHRAPRSYLLTAPLPSSPI
jgi:hypothetical protein